MKAVTNLTSFELKWKVLYWIFYLDDGVIFIHSKSWCKIS